MFTAPTLEATALYRLDARTDDGDAWTLTASLSALADSVAELARPLAIGDVVRDEDPDGVCIITRIR